MRTVVATVAVSAALVAAYLALGGASYAPAKVADPCAAREWRDPGGFAQVAEQIVLSALDGAACELGVSREEVVLALADRDSFERFARAHGIDADELEAIARSGLIRAIDDAEDADALNPAAADLLRGLARRVPISEILDLVEFL